jgi:cytoskeletal protein RodZ
VPLLAPHRAKPTLEQEEDQMRKQNWLLLIVGLMACGLIAAGCGDSGDDSSSDDSTAVESTTSSTESTTSEDTSTEDTTSEDTTTEDTTTDSSSGEIDLDSFTNACLDTFSKQGVTGSVADDACKQFTDQFQKCADEADSDAAIEICQQIADEAVKQLQAGG